MISPSNTSTGTRASKVNICMKIKTSAVIHKWTLSPLFHTPQSHQVHSISIRSVFLPKLLDANPAKNEEETDPDILRNSSACLPKLSLMICGQGRAGKTSFLRSLLGLPHSSLVDSTIGVEMEKAACSVSWIGKKCVWRPVKDEQTQLMQLMAKALLSAEESSAGYPDVEAVPEEDATHCEDREHSTEAASTGAAAPREATEGRNLVEVSTPKSLRPSNQSCDEASSKSAKFVKHFHSSQASMRDDNSAMAFIDIMDFAGQEAFTVVQHMLINNERCGHAVVFDVSKPLDEVADMSFSVNGVEHPIVNTAGKTNFDILEEWLMVLYEAGGGECPLYLVACKIDLISWWDREEYKRQVREYLWSNLKGKPYESIVEDIIFVDNTKSGRTFFADEAVVAFRDRFLSDVMKTKALSTLVPLRWLPFTIALHSLAEQRRPVLQLDEAIALAKRAGGCTTRSEALDLLHCHHQLGHLLHFRDNVDLRQYVIVDIHWLLRIVSALLVPCHDVRLQNKRFRSHYALLYTKGILVESLIRHMWQTYCPSYADELLDGELSHLVFTLMEEFALLFYTQQMVIVDSEEPCRKYLMPSMVTSQMELVVARLSSARVVYSPPVYLLVQLRKLFHKTVFWRLAVGLMLHFREEMPDVSRAVTPTLHQNALRLLVGDNYWLEIQHFSTGLGLTVQLDSDPSIHWADVPQAQSMEDVCRRTLLLVESKLKALEMGGSRRHDLARASVCLCSLSFKPCTKHGVAGCSTVECQHFIHLEDKPQARCPLADRCLQDVSAVLHTWIQVLQVI